MKAPFMVFCALLLGSLSLRADGDIPQLVAGKLFILNSGGQQPVDDSALADIKYYAIYYSAQWCPPCHHFTPHLVKFYNEFKPSHSNFELIFVSEDYDPGSMLSYMKEMSMPWPAVRFSQLRHSGSGTFKGPGIESFANKGIPDLVLVDSTGKVLSDSHEGDRYVGPEKVIKDIQNTVK